MNTAKSLPVEQRATEVCIIYSKCGFFVHTHAQGFHIACDEYGKVIVFDSTGKINVTYVSVGQVVQWRSKVV